MVASPLLVSLVSLSMHILPAGAGYIIVLCQENDSNLICSTYFISRERLV